MTEYQNESPVARALAGILADSYGLMLKTHNYHWNVEGPHFTQLHTLFEGQYTELFTAVDVIAERIRALGDKAPGSYKDFAGLSTIPDGNADAGANDMIAELAADNKALAERAKKASEVAANAEDKASEDLMVGRIQAHEKAAWMLTSSLSS